MSVIRDEMPVLVRHEGDWAGTYTVVDNQGNILDKYNSHLTCKFPEQEAFPYFQINRYNWPDGKHQEYSFPGMYKDKQLWFDTERIEGHAWETDSSTIILYFSYKGVPEPIYIYELIVISPCNNHRVRTWHWFRNNQIYQRTLITEERVQ
ncbi:MAG: DUF3598 domain-containing protein [Symploca sp. SIO3C6]|uniref:DUF3598 domain-containing protein n=1 Tax=Symploca sp. SIO1C4 TaxID=2607765 RepID=A0A6B3NPW3_9CYAN|nr:DUF3598 domain-containing protein [Symploca sp. SIO3C6]NER32352.1 DUF3598 domain-containing protein [Symploca sp. SIO1C4]NET06284.1 DUF3598 domain-containing protein [Symploca sp. SIO2B6]